MPVPATVTGLSIHGFAAGDSNAGIAAREQISSFLTSIWAGSPKIELPSACLLRPDQSCGIESKRSKPALPAVDKTLARRLAQLQKLPRRDRDALLRTLDAFLAKSSHAA